MKEESDVSLQLRKVILLGLLFGILTLICTISLILGLIASVPLIFAYYKHGPQVFLVSSLVGIIGIGLYTYIFSKNPELAMATESTLDHVDSLPGTSQSFSKDLKYIQISILEISLRVIGIWIFLVLSKYKWMIRILCATIVLSIGTIPIFMLSEVRNMFFELFNSIQTTTGSQFITPEQGERLIRMLIPVVSMGILLFNWILTTYLLSIRLKFNFAEYCEYLYTKILNEFSSLKSWELFGMVGILVFLNQQQGVLKLVHTVTVSMFLVVIAMYIITGFAYGYFLFMTKRMGADWYFFLVCIIMIIPFINLSAIFGFLLMGIIFNWNKTKLQNVRGKK